MGTPSFLFLCRVFQLLQIDRDRGCGAQPFLDPSVFSAFFVFAPPFVFYCCGDRMSFATTSSGPWSCWPTR